MGRIFLFGSAVVSVLLLTLIYAIVSGQYLANQPVASGTPVPNASVATSPGESASTSASESASAAASGSASAEPSTSASGEAVTVVLAKLAFGPDLTVAAGTPVTFMNNDAVPHTATDGTDGVPAPEPLFDLQLAIGASDSYTFPEPGRYQVTCTLHPTMNMTITVE